MNKIISGIQSTGSLHLGNYLGSISKNLSLQNQYQLNLFVANLHTITVDFDRFQGRQNIIDLVKIYLASGLDVSKNNIFLQSDINEHPALGHVLLCHTTMGELERMTQYKDKKQKFVQNNQTIKIPTGLLTYPTLMAADILLYNADYVCVGDDQKQHIELTRNIAIRMNNKYGELFKVPEPIIAKVGARIMDLANPSKKMSKSALSKKGIINLDDSKEDVFNKIKSAKTDNLNTVGFDYKTQPEISNLVGIYYASINDHLNNELRTKLFNKSSEVLVEDVINRYHNKSYKDFKEELFEIIWNILGTIQTNIKNISDEDVKKVLMKGKENLLPIAQATLLNVYKKLGMVV
ncbi:tryptophan--tRNA ligase [Mycoplasma sp. T363T]|uniref:Tryptophan--tRNA ligase n=1 Tax=Mycoplasma bradburyae TaxID=2963128 RepID=A0ABT5G9P6_9MOLU|nr:tryptophan--tRNA ligase [Mycoplasma bradburyae]MDC4163028.1 tryptophan--tRNA ligase [Mycoplasma bradburyae]MDC4181639.1 tryptophan--tRNA ligase [Mycoplasma bradburyae]UTS69939.1 tryptophan--tRNA ligase [Mycoplasma bradburyae]